MQAATMLLLAAGCVAPPTGPILGDWRGTSPGAYVDQPKVVELVLSGSQDAVSGQYHVAITLLSTQIGSGAGTTRWQGDWVGSQEMIDGHVERIIRLRHMIAGEIDRYELAADGTLRPVNQDGRTDHPYTAAQIALYALQPLRRDSRNYGLD